MKRIATIASSALVALGMGLLATAASKPAQPKQKYVEVNQKLIKDAAEEAVKGISDVKEKAYIKDLIERAFAEYNSGNAAKVEVYEKDAIDELKSEIKGWKDSVEILGKQIKRLAKEKTEAIKPYRDTVAILRKQLNKENVEGQISALRVKHKNDSLIQDSEIKTQKAEINRLRADSAKLAADNAALAENSKIAVKVNEHVSALRGKVDELYTSYVNSQDLRYVDLEVAEDAAQKYEEYLKMIGLTVEQEEQEKINQILAVAKVAKHYNAGIEILGKKYDAKAVKKWNGGVKELTPYIPKLNSGQKTVWQNVLSAFATIDVANEHFKTSIIPYLKDQGELPTGAEVKEVNEMIKLKVKNFADGRYRDTTKYHELHTHLNEVLETAKNGIKVMGKSQYKEFVRDIENML